MSTDAAAASAAGKPADRRLRMGLSWKFAAAFIGLVSFVLIVNGSINLWLSYDEAKRAAVRVQQEKAQAAAERVSLFVSDIESQMGWTTRAEWAHIPVEQRRYDFIRLLRQAPPITELIQVDGAGKEQLKLSRLEPDVVASGADYSADPRFMKAVAEHVWFSPVYFRRGSEPYMTVSVAHAGRNPGATIAEVNLKLIWDVVTSIRIGERGYAYIVNAQGKLVAHPDMSLVLRDTDLSHTPQVASALAAPQQGAQVNTTETGTGLDGSSVLTAYAGIPRINWIVFVQLPLSEALAPVYASLLQTAALLGLGLLLASVVGTLLARRMVVPIRHLQQGAERMGEGDLSQRISIRTGDEIETLADRFNVMASRIQESHETLESKVEGRTRDLNEALQQQTATADVLKVISRSAFDLKTVLDTLVASAVRLCQADKGVIFQRDADVYRLAANFGFSHAFEDYAKNHPFKPGLESTTGRVALEGKPIHVLDVLADTNYAASDYQKLGGYRTNLGVPLLREGEPIGVFVLAREAVSPFSEKQIELVQTFADQAVIAIENVRLFEEVRARTKELAQSLDELRNAQDRLVQSEKLASLGQLTAGIAHEIKNPLNFVNNFADLSIELVDELHEVLAASAAKLDDKARVEVDELTEMLKANLGKVVQHGRRADSIVKNMLLHSREGTGERRSVDLNATVEESLNLAYHGARAEKPGFNVTMVKQLDPNVGEVEIYPQEFIRVLLNLISNGFYAANKRKVEAAEPGFEPTLTVSTKRLGERVEIHIRDNGTGIPDAVKEKMFNPFFTTKPAGEGTGLGLSLSFDIIKQHGGTISVETQPGVFTEFTVTLPRISPPVAATRPS